MSEWSLPDPASRVRALPQPGDAPATSATPDDGPIGQAQSASRVALGGRGRLGDARIGAALERRHQLAGACCRPTASEAMRRITLLLGLVMIAVGVMALVSRLRRAACILALVAAAIVVVVAGYNAFDLDSVGTASDQMASLEIGHGLLITAIGGGVGIVEGPPGGGVPRPSPGRVACPPPSSRVCRPSRLLSGGARCARPSVSCCPSGPSSAPMARPSSTWRRDGASPSPSSTSSPRPRPPDWPAWAWTRATGWRCCA